MMMSRWLLGNLAVYSRFTVALLSKVRNHTHRRTCVLPDIRSKPGALEWLSRWSMAVLIGAGAGISIYGVYNSNLLAQIRATMVPLYVAGELGTTINNWILVIGVIGVLLYFLFTVPVKGPLKYVTTFGRVLMMITFGVSFGNVVMGRISLLLGVLETVYGKWLGLMR